VDEEPEAEEEEVEEELQAAADTTAATDRQAAADLQAVRPPPPRRSPIFASIFTLLESVKERCEAGGRFWPRAARGLREVRDLAPRTKWAEPIGLTLHRVGGHVKENLDAVLAAADDEHQE
jgi:hypothetical protein